MVVKPGYKQTEVGVIPEDWDAVPIKSLTPQNRKNGIVDGPFGSNLKTIHYRTSGIPIITSGYVTDGIFHVDKYLYVDRAKFLEEKRSAVQPGDIVMAKIGERCGASAILPATHETGILSGNALKITVDESRHSTSYVWQVLWSLHVSGKLEVLRTTGAQPALSMANLKRYKIPVPRTKAEQHTIAKALSDVDALLDGLDRLIAKKRDLKQAAMQQLLTGQTRLPGFHGEWGMKQVGELALLKNGYAFKSNTYKPLGTFKVITIASVQDGYMIDEASDTIESEPIDLQPHQRLRFGDILISMTGNVGRVCRVNKLNCLLNQRVGKLVPIGTDADFLFEVLRKPSFIVAMTCAAKGGAQPNLSATDITGYILNIPIDIHEQAAIAKVLSDMNAEIALLEARRDKTRDLKQAMMQELLTGKTRLVPTGGSNA